MSDPVEEFLLEDGSIGHCLPHTGRWPCVACSEVALTHYRSVLAAKERAEGDADYYKEQAEELLRRLVRVKAENARLREALEKIIAIESPWLGYCPDCFERPKLMARDALKEPT